MIGFAGLAHLGIVSSLAAAARGERVVAFDPDQRLCTELTAGRLPLHEPGLTELHAAHRSQVRYTSAASELAQCEVVFFSLDVATDDAGHSDLGPLERLIDAVTPSLTPGTVVVLLSQVPPGYVRRWASALEDCAVYYQVETLIFGRAVERATQPERFIIGCADPRQELPAAYARFLHKFGCPVLPMRYESAELAKIAINMFLAASVSTTNVLAEICENIGADWAEIVPSLRLDRRIGPHAYLSPGLGISGGNLERDLATVRNLAQEHGTEAGVIDAWRANSIYRRDWVLRVLHEQIWTRLDDPAVALWGLAYKPDTTSTKNSPAIRLLDILDPGRVRAFDPQVKLPANAFPDLVQTRTALDACRAADVLLVMTSWREFAAVDLGAVREAMAGRTIVDPFGSLDGARCRELGFAYHRLGAPAALVEVTT